MELTMIFKLPLLLVYMGMANNACGSMGEGIDSTEYKFEQLDRLWDKQFSLILLLSRM